MDNAITTSVLASVLSSGVIVALINYIQQKKKVNIETKKIINEAEAIKISSYISISEYWQKHAKHLTDEIDRINQRLLKEIGRGDICEKKVVIMEAEIKKLKSFK